MTCLVRKSGLCILIGPKSVEVVQYCATGTPERGKELRNEIVKGYAEGKANWGCSKIMPPSFFPDWLKSESIRGPDSVDVVLCYATAT